MSDPRYLRGASSPDPDSAEPGGMRWPSWMDATFQLLAASVRYTQHTTPLGGIPLVIPGDSRRWAIGFMVAPGAAGSLVMAPTEVLVGQGFALASPASVIWLPIFTYGPMVALPWNVSSSAPKVFTLAEVSLQ